MRLYSLLNNVWSSTWRFKSYKPWITILKTKDKYWRSKGRFSSKISTLSNFIQPASKKPAIDIAKNPLDSNGSDPWKDESRFNSAATRKESRELTFSWLQLIIRCVFSFFRGKKGGKSFLSRGEERLEDERERERSSAKGSTDDYSRQRGRGLLQRWVGGAAELKRNVEREGQAASRYESSFPTFKSNLRTSNPPRMEVLTGGHLCAPATKSIRTDGREL